MNLYKKVKSIKAMSILSICLVFTLIFAPITLMLTWISIAQIMKIDWKNEQLNNQKSLWGGLSIFQIGITGPLTFSNLAISLLK